MQRRVLCVLMLVAVFVAAMQVVARMDEHRGARRELRARDVPPLTTAERTAAQHLVAALAPVYLRIQHGRLDARDVRLIDQDTSPMLARTLVAAAGHVPNPAHAPDRIVAVTVLDNQRPNLNEVAVAITWAAPTQLRTISEAIVEFAPARIVDVDDVEGPG